jgi:hypothetical protein
MSLLPRKNIFLFHKVKTQTMEFYSAIRKNETMWFESKWMQLEDTMLNEERMFSLK